CGVAEIGKIEQIIFEAGLTFGIRRQIMQRSKLAREFVGVSTKFGELKIKVGKWAGKIVNVKPEFADCARAAQKHKTSVKEVLEAAMLAYRQK
ncbi:MAG: nickel insertion protein, partial [Sedimentisphaerales bacterium]